ncbi:2Fe-2S iron-sulfur cluster-binding protein [Thalassococcus sp. S3]|uniref:2Fe-2S iron-sulfur cluster-binding protein n=1 Tax=Thalassococcus sp. S3 TaxID=2017482 RepID=UPI00102418BA|nr:2Fe-2S iron-sulfur cluster-binding protein [Thalassococcus sp. S3]QBF33366.1 2Fe-2S ferredoxin [Thalassococcus sp. S3]
MSIVECDTATITIVTADGTEYSATSTPGDTLMEVAVRANVPQIIAQCGGACACATCHVYIDEAWRDRLDPPTATEEEMLEFAHDPGPGSRLSCQITLSAALNGLRVRVPSEQA